MTICAAVCRGAPVILAFSPCICRRILTISSGFVKTCGYKQVSIECGLERDGAVRTTWQPPARPPANSSHLSLILPVSLSVAYSRTRSLTVNLMAFSGATPCAQSQHQSNTELNEEADAR